MTTPDGYPRWDPLAQERHEAERETLRSGYLTPREQARDDYGTDAETLPTTHDETDYQLPITDH